MLIISLDTLYFIHNGQETRYSYNDTYARSSNVLFACLAPIFGTEHTKISNFWCSEHKNSTVLKYPLVALFIVIQKV